MDAKFFATALKTALAERHLNQAQLAEFLGVDPAYVSRWLKGASPRLEQIVACLERLGWNLSRALPEYDPFRDSVSRLTAGGWGEEQAKALANQPSAGLIEELRAASQRTRERGIETLSVSRDVDSVTGTLRPLAKSACTSFVIAEGFFPVREWSGDTSEGIRVRGEGLRGVCSDGGLLILRSVRSQSTLPDESLALIPGTGKTQQPQLRRVLFIRDGKERVSRVVALGLTGKVPPLVFGWRQAKILSVVVGTIAPLGDVQPVGRAGPAG